MIIAAKPGRVVIVCFFEVEAAAERVVRSNSELVVEAEDIVVRALAVDDVAVMIKNLHVDQGVWLAKASKDGQDSGCFQREHGIYSSCSAQRKVLL